MEPASSGSDGAAGASRGSRPGWGQEPRSSVPGLWQDNGDKERVRDAASIDRVVGEVVALKPKGRELVGLCPFHDDHRPSMAVIPAKGIFHCFVCQTGGDVFTFVQKFHKMEFREALEFLAERFGVPLTPRRAPEPGAQEGPGRGELLDVNAAAAGFFRAVLGHAEHGRAARSLIERRGMSDAMVEQFGVGASPDRWDGLVLKARQAGWNERALLELGLLKPRDSGGVYDALRNRLIFPIHDQTGRVIAFGGRRIDDADEPKYLNSPETRLFDKSKTLYGLHLASRAIQAEKTAIITEGYTDAIACHQGGFANAVATLGTALTREHARVLRRMCESVVLLFDGDDAGQRAADRATEVFFAEPLDVKICTLNRFTDAKDPDELLKREGGAEVFRRALAASTDLLEYRIARLRERLAGAGLSALARAVEEEIAALVSLGLRDVPPIRQALVVRRLAELSGLDEATIRRAIPAGRAARTASGGDGASEPGSRGADESAELAELGTTGLPEVHLLGCILCDGELRLALEGGQRDLIAPGAYDSALLRSLANIVADVARAGRTPDLEGVLRQAEGEAVQSAAVALQSRIESITGGDAERLREHFRGCVVSAEQKRGRVAPGGASLQERIELKRRQHATLGADRTILPKPR